MRRFQENAENYCGVENILSSHPTITLVNLGRRCADFRKTILYLCHITILILLNLAQMRKFEKADLRICGLKQKTPEKSGAFKIGYTTINILIAPQILFVIEYFLFNSFSFKQLKNRIVL